MRVLTTILFLLGAASLAQAHTLPGDQGILLQLSHQLFGLHHLPPLLLIAVAGYLLFRKSRSEKE
jgi:hypothetical protein